MNVLLNIEDFTCSLQYISIHFVNLICKREQIKS